MSEPVGPITVHPQPARRSSTLWLNGGVILSLVLAAAIGGIGDLGLDPLTQARVLYVLALANAALNGWLRLRTHEPLAGTVGEQKARAEHSS